MSTLFEHLIKRACYMPFKVFSNGDLKYPRIHITTYFCLLMEGWKVQGICRFPCLQTLLGKAGKGWKVKAHQFWSASYKSTDGSEVGSESERPVPIHSSNRQQEDLILVLNSLSTTIVPEKSL